MGLACFVDAALWKQLLGEDPLLGAKRGFWAPELTQTDANPAFGPLETKLGAWISNRGLGQVIWGLD